MPSVLQPWLLDLPFMQQTVVIELTRGPDGIPKYHPSKFLMRWIRRCFLVSALDGEVITNPYDPRGGSFTGPSMKLPVKPPTADFPWESAMDHVVSDYLRSVDEMPHHFHLHLIHGVEIIGYKHPNLRIRAWFNKTYVRLVEDMHLWPETEEQLDRRLGDTMEGWLERADPATRA